MIHGPSLAIGAGIASIVIIIAFIGFEGIISNQSELVIEPAPTIQQVGPPKITTETFLANGSPVLGNSDAPITLIEFGDYQCHFCNVFFHSTEDDILKNIDTWSISCNRCRNYINCDNYCIYWI